MTEAARYYFHPLDYVILALALVASLGVGFYQAYNSRKKRTTDEYLMGSRQFGILPVALSLIASFISSIGLIGVPAEIHYYGIQSTFSMFSLFLASIISSVTFVPLFLPLKITSSQEYLQLRYKARSVRLLGASILLLSSLFYTGCVVYGQAAALEATTGLPSWASIILVNVLGTIYTACGGMKAVIWTDVFQITIMFFSMLMVIIMGLVKVGGPANMWQVNYDWGRIFVELDPSLYRRLSVWSTLLSGTVGYWGTYGISQTAVQRYCAVGSIAKAKKTMVVNAFGKFIFAMICIIVGMVTFAFYAQQDCDPYASGKIPNKNQIVPLFIMDVFPYPGVPGIFLSGLFSGSLSTISSSISAMCAVTWEDIFKPHIGHRLTASQQVTVNQIIALFWGLAGLGMTFAVHNVGGSLLQIAKGLWGICAGPGLGIFLLGAFFPWTNWIGALTGAFSAMFFITWIFIGQSYLRTHSTALPIPSAGCFINATLNMTAALGTSMSQSMTSMYTFSTPADVTPPPRSFLDDWFYSISFMWYAVIGVTLCLTIGLATSFITGATDPATVEKRFLFPFMRSRFGKEDEEKKDTTEKMLEPLMEMEKTIMT